MYIMYNQYEEEIASKFIDEEDTLSILAESLDKTEIFKDSIIYIDEFVGYTKQEYDIIRKLLKLSLIHI